jgi:hypothetical protein
VTKLALALASIFLFISSAKAQGKARALSPTLASVLTSVDSDITKAMDAEGSGVNFSHWDAPIGFINAAKQAYEAQQMAAYDLHSLISRVVSNREASSPELFRIYDRLGYVREILIRLADNVMLDQKDPHLAADLIRFDATLVRHNADFRDAVENSIEMDASDLAACPSATSLPVRARVNTH